MAKTNNLTDFLTDLADGIRTAEGTSDAINPQNFKSHVTTMGDNYVGMIERTVTYVGHPAVSTIGGYAFCGF